MGGSSTDGPERDPESPATQGDTAFFLHFNTVIQAQVFEANTLKKFSQNIDLKSLLFHFLTVHLGESYFTSLNLFPYLKNGNSANGRHSKYIIRLL